MDSQIRPAGETADLELNANATSGNLAKLPSDEQSSSQEWKRAGEEFANTILLWLDRSREFFEAYKVPLIALGIAIVAMPFIWLFIAFIMVINALPLFAPTLKLVGFTYTCWFIYRYLLFASGRQELVQGLEGLKKQFVGDVVGKEG
jgi:hypothetical protein